MRTLVLTSAILLAACSSSSTDKLSSDEALESVNEASSNNQAAQLASASIDIAARFTLSADAQTTLVEIASFVAVQFSCASVAITGNELVINYGANGGTCTFDGLVFSGQQTISIESISGAAVKIDHAWTNFSDGTVVINGIAQVSWTATDLTRHVSSNITWTRTWDGMKGQGSANVTQTASSAGIATGIIENGSRTWTDANGEWSLTLNNVEERWIDPLPQSGTFAFAISGGTDTSVTFARVNDTTIAATIATSASSYTFNVTQAGQPAQ